MIKAGKGYKTYEQLEKEWLDLSEKNENYKQQVTDLNRKIKEYEKMLQGKSTVFNDNEARKYRAMCLQYLQENKKLKERCVKLEKDCREKQEKINNLSFAHKVLDK